MGDMRTRTPAPNANKGKDFMNTTGLPQKKVANKPSKASEKGFKAQPVSKVPRTHKVESGMTKGMR